MSYALSLKGLFILRRSSLFLIPASRAAGLQLLPILRGLSLPSCQDLIFPVTPSSGPRKCQLASWERGPPAGEQAARRSFVFGAALPISLYSAHMPRAKREAGQAPAKLDNGLPER